MSAKKPAKQPARKTAPRIYLCGEDGPVRPDGMQERFYFGVVPADFNEDTGLSKTHKQVRESAQGRYVWVRR